MYLVWEFFTSNSTIELKVKLVLEKKLHSIYFFEFAGIKMMFSLKDILESDWGFSSSSSSEAWVEKTFF